MAHMDNYRAQVAARKQATKTASQTLHTRYWLIMVNGMALVALVTYGFAVRAAEADVDEVKMHTMMDSDSAMPYGLLTPPEVR